MARVRDPNRNKAFEIYEKHGGKIDLVEIASQLNISPGTIRGWKSNKNRFTRWKKSEIYWRENNSFGRSRHRNIDSVQSNKRKIVKEYSEWKSLN